MLFALLSPLRGFFRVPAALVGLTLAFLEACGDSRGISKATPPTRLSVVNGTALSLFEVQSLGLVALLADATRADRRGVCSGTLVAPTLVLTAAHCLANPLGSPRVAAFGTDAFSAAGQLIAITKSLRLPTADIAVLTLASAAPIGFAVQPLLLELPVGAGFTNLAAFGAGFGRNSTESNLSGGLPRKGNTQITILERGMPIVIARSGQGSGFCFGDSGGPLFAQIGGRRVVVGVLSQGASTCETGLDTFISIPFYGNAIKILLKTL